MLANRRIGGDLLPRGAQRVDERILFIVERLNELSRLFFLFYEFRAARLVLRRDFFGRKRARSDAKVVDGTFEKLARSAAGTDHDGRLSSDVRLAAPF